MTGRGHRLTRLTRLAMDVRAVYDRLLDRQLWHDAAELKRIAKELDQFRIDLESAPAAADTGVLNLGGVPCSACAGTLECHEPGCPRGREDVDETKRTR